MRYFADQMPRRLPSEFAVLRLTGAINIQFVLWRFYLQLLGCADESEPDCYSSPLLEGLAVALIDWTSPRVGQLAYSYSHFGHAKGFFFAKWCERAAQRELSMPTDLSGSCKYGSLFMQTVFGGAIRGHYEHQYNFIDGRLVDLSHDALDVGRIRYPYQHEPDYFTIPEFQASLALCVPVTEGWAREYVALG